MQADNGSLRMQRSRDCLAETASSTSDESLAAGQIKHKNLLTVECCKCRSNFFRRADGYARNLFRYAARQTGQYLARTYFINCRPALGCKPLDRLAPTNLAGDLLNQLICNFI